MCLFPLEVRDVEVRSELLRCFCLLIKSRDLFLRLLVFHFKPCRYSDGLFSVSESQPIRQNQNEP